MAARFGTAILDLWKEVDVAVGDLVDQAQRLADEQGRELAVLVLSDHGFAGVHRAFRPQSFLKNPPGGEAPITSTYSLETNASMIYVPKRGREANGGLSPEDHARTVDEVLGRMLAAEDPLLGAKPVLFGGKREDVFRGRYVSKAPDLVFLARPPYYLIHEEGDKEPFGTPAFTFNAHHEIHGILIASGPMFGSGRLEGRQSLLDLSPTLLHLLGETIPGYMEGEPLTGMLTPEWSAAHPVSWDETEARETGSDELDPVKAIPYLQ
jgi:predicted AlkP superfamily phosphohydrolase/phosphomutase